MKRCYDAVGWCFVSAASYESQFGVWGEILFRMYKVPTHRQLKHLVVPKIFQMMILILVHEGIMARRSSVARREAQSRYTTIEYVLQKGPDDPNQTTS